MRIKLTMAMDGDIAEKMIHIGKYYGHSRIKGTEQLCCHYIRDRASKHGEISRKDRKRL